MACALITHNDYPFIRSENAKGHDDGEEKTPQQGIGYVAGVMPTTKS